MMFWVVVYHRFRFLAFPVGLVLFFASIKEPLINFFGPAWPLAVLLLWHYCLYSVLTFFREDINKLAQIEYRQPQRGDRHYKSYSIRWVICYTVYPLVMIGWTLVYACDFSGDLSAISQKNWQIIYHDKIRNIFYNLGIFVPEVLEAMLVQISKAFSSCSLI